MALGDCVHPPSIYNNTISTGHKDDGPIREKNANQGNSSRQGLGG